MATSIERQRKALVLRTKPAVYCYNGRKLKSSSFGGREMTRTQQRLVEALAAPGVIEQLLEAQKEG